MKRFGVWVLLICLPFLMGQISHRYVVAPTPAYILVTFNGTYENLRVLWSLDAIHFWGKTPDVYYNPGDGLTRDPSITYYGGKYWLAHTNAIASPPLDEFTIASSTDGVTWSAPSYVSTAGGLSTDNTWAPKWFLDPADSGLSSVHVFVSIAQDGTNDFQIYELHPTAADFSTWSDPAAITVTGVSWLIDPFIVYKGSTYYLWYKSSATYICYASASTLTGTYTNVQTGNWAGWGSLQEGPSVLNLGGSPVRWRIYMDDYQDSNTLGQLNYSESTDDWSTWTAKVPINTPGQAKHGTIWPLQ